MALMKPVQLNDSSVRDAIETPDHLKTKYTQNDSKCTEIVRETIETPVSLRQLLLVQIS